MLWIFLEALETDCGEIAVDLWIPQARLPRLSVQQQFDGLVARSSSKRRMICQKLIKHRAKTVNVCGAADGRVVSHGFFRRHVTWPAHHFHSARDRAFRFTQSRKSEVG